MKRLIVILAGLVLVAASCGAAGENRVLPDVELELLDGGTYELQQTGQPRALNLWATWCAPCRAELPAFENVSGRVDNVEIVGVNTGDRADSAKGLVQELGLSFTQVADPDASLQSTLRITGMPATIFVDAQGEIVRIHSGELEQDELESLLVELFDATFTTP